MSFKWNERAFDRAKEEAAQRLQRAAVYFVKQHQAKLSVSNPLPYLTPSKPGEYPRKRTGALIGGVIFSPVTSDGIIDGNFKVRIGIMRGVWYGLYLEEKLDRLGFQDTLQTLRTQINTILQRKVA